MRLAVFSDVTRQGVFASNRDWSETVNFIGYLKVVAILVERQFSRFVNFEHVALKKLTIIL